MVELKIRRIGGSLGVLLPSTLLTELNVQEGDTLFLNRSIAKPNTLEMTPLLPADTIFVEAARKTSRKYRVALQALAEERESLSGAPKRPRNP